MMQVGKSKIDSKKPKLTQKLTPADKKILKALDKTVVLIDKYLENFQFGQAARQLYSFFWHDFCDLYIEKAKKQEDKKTKQILSYVLLSSLKLLHPFIPFVTEEIYQGLPIKNKKKCLIIEDWPK
jgi:valyl-tRNA synthetase